VHELIEARGLPPKEWRAFLIGFLRIRGARMGRTKTEKGRVIDDTFRREAVRILASGGRTIKAVADDLGIGMSSLGAWKRKLDRADLMAGPHEDVEKELARLRRENELLRAERDLLKKATAFFAKETSR
jgi:transposase